MWRNFAELTKQLLAETNARPRVVNLTTFGVCWGAVSKAGKLLYPVISWKCTRTRTQLAWAREHVDLNAAYLVTGAPPFYFNSAFSLRWMREHRSDVLDKADAFLFMPQLFVQRLTGELVTDRTMAATAMLYDLRADAWSADLLAQFDLPNKFPPVRDPGDPVGQITAVASEATGIPPGTPVCAGGHDTALATAGACRDLRSTVLYSTGTWSILVATRDEYDARVDDSERNLLWELNPQRTGVVGGFNRQGHMIGGLSFDLMRKKFLPNASAATATDKAATVPAGSNGVLVVPTFVAGTGPDPKTPSAIVGWEDGMAPENAVRATLEGLAYQTRASLANLRGEASSILIGGGFAKNRLFAQILADVTGKPVELAGIPEVTTVGTAVLAMVGCGIVKSVEEAWANVKMPVTLFEPRDSDVYEPLYAAHRRVIEALAVR
jgi:L-fuculokinase